MEPLRVQYHKDVIGPVRKEQAWRVITDFSKFQDSVSDIDEVQVLSQNSMSGRSEWWISLGDLPLHWVQEERFEKKQWKICFTALTGELKSFSGFWSVQNRAHKGIRIELIVSYLLGVPVIDIVLGDIFKEKMEALIQKMVDAVHRLLCDGRVEYRSNTRVPIDMFNDIRVEDRYIRAYVSDFGSRGMAIQYHPSFDAIYDKIYLGSLCLPVHEFFNSSHDNICRIVFKRTLLKEEVASAVNRLLKHNIRQHRRHVIGKDMVFRSKREQFTANLVDVSVGGLRIRSKTHIQKLGEILEIGGQQIPIRKQIHDKSRNSTRVEFVNTVQVDEFLRQISGAS